MARGSESCSLPKVERLEVLGRVPALGHQRLPFDVPVIVGRVQRRGEAEGEQEQSLRMELVLKVIGVSPSASDMRQARQPGNQAGDEARGNDRADQGKFLSRPDMRQRASQLSTTPKRSSSQGAARLAGDGQQQRGRAARRRR
jgi:hypothetical protein